MQERQGCGRFALPVVDLYKLVVLIRTDKEKDRILLFGDRELYKLVGKSWKEGTVRLQKNDEIIEVHGCQIDHVVPKDYYNNL